MPKPRACVEPERARRLAVLDVVNRHHPRLTRVRAKAAHDRHERLSELLELLLRVPHVEHLDLSVNLHGAVERPPWNVAEACPGFLEFAVRLVVCRDGESLRLEVESE